MSRFPQQLTSNYINSLDPAGAAGGGPPTGAASGDLTGVYPGPFLSTTGVAAGVYGDATNIPRFTVDSKGRVTSATAVPAASGTPSGPASGDLTGTYPAPILTNSGVVAGTYGTASIVPRISVDSKGRVTGVTNVAVSGGVPSGPAGGDLTGTFPNPDLTATGVIAGLYGNATTVPQLAVDAKGRVTGVTNVAISVGGGAPTGPAGGDLAGTYPNPVLAASGVSAGTYGGASSSAQVVVDAKGRVTSATDVPIVVAPTGAAGGDLTGTFPNPTLTVSGVAAGIFGSASSVAQVSVDAKGRVISASDIPIVVAPSGSAGGDLTGTYPNPTLTVSGATAGTYGSASSVSQVTVDAKGRVTSAADVAIAVPPSGVAGGDLAGTYPNPTLGPSGVAAGIYGSASLVPQLTLDGKGRVTSATTVAVAGGAPTGAAGGDLSFFYPDPKVLKIQDAPIQIIQRSIIPAFGLPVPNPSPSGDWDMENTLVERYPATSYVSYKGTFSKSSGLAVTAAFLRHDVDASSDRYVYFIEVEVVAFFIILGGAQGQFYQKQQALFGDQGSGFQVISFNNVVNNSFNSGGGSGAFINNIGGQVYFNLTPPTNTVAVRASYHVRVMGSNYIS